MLVRSLENTKQPVLIYTAKAAVLSLAFSVIASFVIGFVLPDIGTQSHDLSNPLLAVFSLLVFAPAAETLLMIPVFAFVRLGIRNQRIIAICSALLWAGLHSLAWPYWG